MRYGPIHSLQTGISVPLTAIRSPEQFGCGEFADLPGFARWVRDSGFDLVQILPVQDTGNDPSPYAARGALALHPIHLRLTDLPGAEAFTEELAAAAAEFAGASEVAYEILDPLKRRWLRRIFDELDPVETWQRARSWIRDNAWIRPHAVYCVLCEREGGRSWTQWRTDPGPVEAAVARHWEEASTDLLFHVWVQQHADLQFSAAAREVDAIGVRLKGDLPILCTEDSSDVWYHRRYFDLDARAGAPPDMYAESGQLWGFPCYRWNALAAADHQWWKQRLAQASLYFHALRIDHVLGFFRIWRVGPRARTGMLGYFDPSVPITRTELRSRGFTDARIDQLAATSGRIGATEDEADRIDTAPRSPDELDSLRSLWDRVLLGVDDEGERFRPYWYWHESPLFGSLDPTERAVLRGILDSDGPRQESLWESVGRERLSMVVAATDAMVCGEDLGAVPDCVPRVLRDLGILGLRVERWCRDWASDDRPFVPPSAFEVDTVCSPGVHDASSLRAWWEEDLDTRRAYWRAMGKQGEAPDVMDAELLREVLERNLAAASKLCILSLPDVLALDPSLAPADPRAERINVPGTRGEDNWRWRMPIEIDDLAARVALSHTLGEMAARRKNR